MNKDTKKIINILIRGFNQIVSLLEKMKRDDNG